MSERTSQPPPKSANPESLASGPPGDPDTLSRHAKMVIDIDKQQAEAYGIVMALFAGALVSFAQIVEGVDQERASPMAWQALRVFLYGAIVLNLAGAFLSLAIIKMCSDLPLANYQRRYIVDIKKHAVAAPNKMSPTAAEGGPVPTTEGLSASTLPPAEGTSLPKGVERWHRLGILIDGGMSPRYVIVDKASGYVMIVAILCTFVSLGIWVFLCNVNPDTSRITLIFFVPAAIVVASSFYVAAAGQNTV